MKYPNFESAAGVERESKLEMFQEGKFGPKELNDATLNILNKEAEQVSTIRI